MMSYADSNNIHRIFNYLEIVNSRKCPKISYTNVTDKMAYMQTVQTQIRLLLMEQSDQGLHCLPFHLVFKEKLHKKQNLGQNLCGINHLKF